MHWVVASLVAAVFLGLYELCTKHAVHKNAVLPVLFLANVVSAGLWTVAVLIQRADPELMPALFTVAPLTPIQHAQLALKSFIVACSWVATYFAVKHLPVSIASPIRAMAPVCTLFGALLVLGDMSVQGNIKPLRSLAEPLQLAKDNGARRALIPIENKRTFLDVSADIVEHVDPVFYGDPRTAATKTLGFS